MVAALLIRTSSAIDASGFADVLQQCRAGGIQAGLFAEYEAFVDIGLRVALPQALTGTDDLILHDGRGSPQIDQINRGAGQGFQARALLPQSLCRHFAFDEYCQVGVAGTVCLPGKAAAKTVDGNQLGKSTAQLRRELGDVHEPDINGV